jgi:hypothetical protein
MDHDKLGEQPAATRRLVVVEDRVAYRNHLLRALGGIRPTLPTSSLSHGEFLGLGAWRALGAGDIVLLDVCDIGGQQEHPEESRLRSLDICDRLSTCESYPVVYAYSVFMERPEINVPVREYPFVKAAFDHAGLLDVLGDVVGGTAKGTVAPPGSDDYRMLGLPPTAQVAAAHQLMRTREDAWSLVWRRHHPAPAARTRAWINTYVRDLLDLPEGTYRRIVGLMQRVAGLPQ